MSEADFVEANQEFAGMMVVVPGLLAKVWLKNADEKVYGGIYLWRDREACESFLASDLWASVVKDDSVSDLTSHDYEVNEVLTKATQPVLQVL